MIRLDSLTKVFDTPHGSFTAVDHVTMEVPVGEICVLLGPSGCGKTTTLKMTNQVVTPTSGAVFIDGQDTTNMVAEDLRRNIGYVIQQVGLFPNMTIEENVTVVPRLMGWDKKQYRKRARELMDMLALDADALLKRYPNELSGGQQQRIGVARALAADPPVILMDEPFGAIDPINRATIQNEFLKMQQQLQKTIMFVSHDIDEAVKMGDRIAIFRAGELVQYSKPDELLAAPKDDFIGSFLGEDRVLKRLNLMTVGELSDADIPVVSPGDSLEQAVERMESHEGQDGVLVVNAQREPVGIVDRGAAHAGAGQCRDHCRDVPATAAHDERLRDAAAQMLSHNVTWLPCVDGDGRVCGQITQRAISRHLNSHVHGNRESRVKPAAVTG